MIGIVVDDAIVVGESIHFHVENGIDGERGAVAGASMVVKPVYFAAITTIMMFVPMMLLTGPIRSLFEQISLVVIAVLIFSLIEAFFILPAHLRHLKPVDPNKVRGIMKFQHKLAESLNTFARVFFGPLSQSFSITDILPCPYLSDLWLWRSCCYSPESRPQPFCLRLKVTL